MKLLVRTVSNRIKMVLDKSAKKWERKGSIYVKKKKLKRENHRVDKKQTERKDGWMEK